MKVSTTYPLLVVVGFICLYNVYPSERIEETENKLRRDRLSEFCETDVQDMLNEYCED